jgi:hypothetical protein
MIIESVQSAHDRGYSAGYRKLPFNTGYDPVDNRAVVPGRIDAYFNGYKSGVEARANLICDECKFAVGLGNFFTVSFSGHADRTDKIVCSESCMSTWISKASE